MIIYLTGVVLAFLLMKFLNGKDNEYFHTPFILAVLISFLSWIIIIVLLLGMVYENFKDYNFLEYIDNLSISKWFENKKEIK